MGPPTRLCVVCGNRNDDVLHRDEDNYLIRCAGFPIFRATDLHLNDMWWSPLETPEVVSALLPPLL